MKYRFNREHYQTAVERELDKRETVYHKIIAKKEKEGLTSDQLKIAIDILNGQKDALKVLLELLENDLSELESVVSSCGDWIFSELIREYKMRVKHYPRFVNFYKSLTAEEAEYQLAVWRELCEYYAEVYLFNDDPAGYFNLSIALRRTRAKK